MQEKDVHQVLVLYVQETEAERQRQQVKGKMDTHEAVENAGHSESVEQ